METPKQPKLLIIRRIGMIVGFIFFILFVYKASHDVSNIKIAAGAQRTKQVQPTVKPSTGITNGTLQVSEAATVKPQPLTMPAVTIDTPKNVETAKKPVANKSQTSATKNESPKTDKHDLKSSN